tara:strand:- start:3754 stop:4227 length:474 start_codon:yes stop_codon:yes gene_type:complete
VKRLPTEIKKQRGTLRADRVNDKEPQLESYKPAIPNWLDEEGKSAFVDLSNILFDMKVLTKADKLALELLSDAYSEYKKAKDVISKLGQTQEVTSREGNTKTMLRPELQIANQSFVRIFQLLKEFGLTPSSRAKVNALENQGNSTDVRIENFFNNNE